MKIPYINQIVLNKKGLEENKSFLKAIYSCQDLLEVKKWFDKLDCNISWQRQTDKKMTLEKFLNNMGKDHASFHGTLQINNPDPLKIRYCISFDGNDRISRFVWVIYPYNKNNFKITSDLYEKSFGNKIEDDPLPEDLLKVYKEEFRYLTSD